MSLSWPAKDPNEVLDYDIDWSSRLLSADEIAAGTTTPADTVASSTFTLPSGSLVANSSSYSTIRTKVWLSGGDQGLSYDILNRITTAGGRTMDQTVKLKVKSK